MRFRWLSNFSASGGRGRFPAWETRILSMLCRTLRVLLLGGRYRHHRTHGMCAVALRSLSGAPHAPLDLSIAFYWMTTQTGDGISTECFMEPRAKVCGS